MFRRLRLRLTLVYLAAALALIVLVGAGTYVLLDRYFQTSTDLALQHKMATQFALMGMPLPPELAAADREYRAGRRAAAPPRPPATPTSPKEEHDDSEDKEGEEHNKSAEEHKETPDEQELLYDGELAAIYVLPLAANGQFVAPGGPSNTNPTGSNAPVTPDAGAWQAAMRDGRDLRTAVLAGGSRARLLTYRLEGAVPTPGNGQVAMLQAGRTLADQDRVLSQLLLWLGVLSGISALALGVASWWLAGRSLRPAQAAWSKQQAFVANASHELRAPLTLVRADAEVALRRTANDNHEQRELLEDVLRECDHMNGLVEDLLLLSRLDAGRVEMKKEQIRVGEILAEVQRQVGRLAEQRGVGLVGDAGPSGSTSDGGGSSITGDRMRLRQVLLILLDNALRHTPQGGTVRLRAGAQGGHIALEVEDTGSGIPAEHLPHIFERFYRAAGDRGEEGSGSGLGLSIAKALVEAQGGQISLTSKVGQGTRVTILMPGGK